MIDLRESLACIANMKAIGTYRGQQPGIVKKPFSHYTEGRVVLLRREGDGSYTVEVPIPIEHRREKQGLLRTWGTIICVHASHVEEICTEPEP